MGWQDYSLKWHEVDGGAIHDICIRTKTEPLCQQVEVLYSKTVTRIARQRDAALACVYQEHVGLLNMWVYRIYDQTRIGHSPGFTRVPLPPQIGPASQRADQSALAVRGLVGRAGPPKRRRDGRRF